MIGLSGRNRCWTLALLLMLCGLFIQSGAAQSPLAPGALAPQHSEREVTGPGGESGVIARTGAWLLQQQAQLQRTLAIRLREIRSSPGSGSASALLWASFLYGVLHAVGPGHGKFVIGSYVATQRTQRARAVGLALGSALLQALTAIVLVFTLVGIAGWLSRDALGQVGVIEPVSFGLIALLGLALFVRALRRLLQRIRGHAHDHCCRQAPVPQDSGWALWGALLAVGSRPCSGAVLVLIAANLLGAAWLGAAAALSMALGTGLTVALLALLTVEARDRLGRVLGGRVGSGAVWLGDSVAIAGGLLILLLGSLLLWGSWSAPEALLYSL